MSGASAPSVNTDIAVDLGAAGPARLPLGRGTRLTCRVLAECAARPELGVELSPSARRAMEASAEILRSAHERGVEIYGLTTGFGPHVRFPADERACAQGAGLIAHLGAGWGRMASPEIVRATMVLRLHTLGLGHSGIDPAAAESLADLVNAGIVPAVPEIGSVGASGDLIPLSHIARVLMGQGRVLEDGACVSAGPVLERHGRKPVSLSGRDALALVNGTTFMSAYAALAVDRAWRLVERAERLTGWIYRLLGCRDQALDPRLHAVRNHTTQSRSAAVILEEAGAHGAFADTSRPLQEVYSLRCAPQFLGACRDQLTYARDIVERELGGVSDNPIVAGSVDAPEVLHGGNFQGQQIAFASDATNAAMVQAAVLAERQLDVLCNPDLTGGAPLLLAWTPGATSGLAGLQLTATAMVAEMRQHAGPCAIASIPTNRGNQDVVSMGTMAARFAFEQAERLAGVLGATAIGAAQLSFLRERGRAPGRTTPTPAWMPRVEGLVDDRPLNDDLARVARAMLSTGE